MRTYEWVSQASEAASFGDSAGSNGLNSVFTAQKIQLAGMTWHTISQLTSRAMKCGH
jgi:hypothetical protein